MVSQRPPDWFKPLKARPRPRRLAAFDCEGTGHPNGFICATLWTDKGGQTYFDRSATLNGLTSFSTRGRWTFAHNLEYDMGCLLAQNPGLLDPLFVNGKMYQAILRDAHGHKWTFYDSQNLFRRMSVAQLGAMVGLPKLELPHEVSDKLNQGLAASEFTSSELGLIAEYNRRDAQIVYHAMDALQNELVELGGKLQGSIAGCSMDLFRRAYMEQPWTPPNPGFNNLARMAYYGGRVEPFKVGTIDLVNGYDVNSLYPSVMATIDFPHPDNLHLEMGAGCERRLLNYEGVAHVTIDVPETHVPPLPYRTDGKLFFPSGRLVGAWTHLELRNALDNDCELVSMDWSLFAARTFNPFGPFITDLYARRQTTGLEAPVKDQVYKLLLNSAYGRYGVNTESGLAKALPLTHDTPPDVMAGCDIQLYGGSPFLIKPVGEGKEPVYANVLISAYVAAAARVKMHNLMSGLGEGLAYTDTDSVYGHFVLPEGEGLGELKGEHEEVSLLSVGPKEYGLLLDGRYIKTRVKGIPAHLQQEFLDAGHTGFSQPVGWLNGLRNDACISTWRKTSRYRRKNLSKRAPMRPGLSCGDYTDTRPWSNDELIQRLGQPYA